MKLRRLTGLERDKIESELNELLKLIEELKSILASEQKVLDIIKEELLEVKSRYADDRRTTIDMTAIDYIEDESLIPNEESIVTLTNKGYIKRLNADTYRTQNRGGVGVKGMSTNEEDFVENIVNVSTHDYILFFTTRGRVFRIKGYEIPEFGRQSKGLPIVNLLNLEKDEKITSLLKIEKEEESKYLIFATRDGLIKRTDISEFDSIRNNGKKAITLKDEDELISVKKTDGEAEILMCSSNGRMVRFNEENIRIMGRSASGVKGINLEGSKLINMDVVTENQEVLVITKNGYGKKTPIEEYRITNRGGKGVRTLNITVKNADIVSFEVLNNPNKDVMIVTNEGIIIRIDANQISTMSRVTQGVRLINLKDGQIVSSVAVIDKNEAEETTEVVEAADEVGVSSEEVINNEE